MVVLLKFVEISEGRQAFAARRDADYAILAPNLNLG
jgi:hypothetical protein